MWVVAFLLVVLACATIASAADFQGQGIVWADQVCSQSFGLCHQPFLLGVVAGLIISVYFLRNFIRGNN
jgi:hypothetical protein